MAPPVSRERMVPGLKANAGQEPQQSSSSKRRGAICDTDDPFILLSSNSIASLNFD